MNRNSPLHRIPVLFVILFCAVGGWLLVQNTATPQPAARGAEEKPAGGIGTALALEQAFTKVIARGENSVVSIARVRRNKNRLRKPQERFIPGVNRDADRPDSPDYAPNDFGSGVIVSPLPGGNDRFILTNYHVVKGGPVVNSKGPASTHELYVRLANRRGYYASILAADPRSDLAVLQIDYKKLGLKPADLTPLPLGNKTTYRKGEIVLALGNPYAQARDGSPSASWGMISNISRRPKPEADARDLEARRKETIHHFGTLLQVDTRLDIGTSGGALLNLKGELIGVTTSMAALEGYEKSVGYAIPIDDSFRRVIKTLAQGREVEYGFLGVSPQDVTPHGFGQLPDQFSQRFAAMASRVYANAPAARGGLKADDVILSVNGHEVHDKYALMQRVGRLAPGTRATLRVWRGSTRQELNLTVQLGKWPVINEEDIIATKPRFPSWRGLTTEFPTGRLKYLQIPYRYENAVLVTEVRNKALARNTKFGPGSFVRFEASRHRPFLAGLAVSERYHSMTDGILVTRSISADRSALPLNEFTFTVDAESHGIRIDRFLVRQLRNYTPFRMQRMIGASLARIAGDVVPLTRRMRRDERVSIRLVEPPDKLLEAEPLPVEVLYEDDAIVVVNKPSGQITHPVGKRQSGTLCNALQAHLDRQTPLPGILRPGIVHRLDRLTSGVMLVAKTFLAHRRLSIQFQRNQIRKEYLAIVEGDLQAAAATIDAPIGQIPGGHTILMTTHPDARGAKPAQTAYEVLERSGDTTLVRVKPLTGRIHQIRVHFASIGHPVSGDEFYGPFGEIRAARLLEPDSADGDEQEQNRHLLHASRLSFEHPLTAKSISIESPAPIGWTAAKNA
eukprot:g21413.t1